MEQTSPLPNPPINPPSPQKPILIIFLVVFVVILISLNAYLFMKLQNPPKMPVASSTPIIQTSPTPTPDPTTDWKIYTGKYFTIKYPTPWFMVEEKPWRAEDLFPALKLSPSLNDTQSITITVTNNLDLTLDQFINTRRGINPNTFNTITIGDIDGKINRNFITAFSSELAVVNREGKTFDVLWVKSPGIVIEDKVFDQILSTFKFLE